ncbi:4'-phosphopantetheinyl transferase superfamily protein [Alkalimonas collagenimarina]|uniref:Enterobactin synthase component D n=1 Tax=Alkalimonas collagenimarina TaxID=400390 RepID=A0ABT9GX75_9GAMM|nr:4'-phosphopantetheinyl transferase superfamily protein [Alkalimonas collagenimarina]MDP4535568.1 4'-phosphopantetheinyl transferase superfamily protein [Alkalimonas collagenimarina]
MSCPPFPFLSVLPLATSTVASLFKIQLFSDTLQRLILARGNFSLGSFQHANFADLALDLPTSIEGSVVKRQAEYLAGRYLARLSMQQSGLFNPVPPQLGIGMLRAPAWPEIVTGSITHHQYSACAVVLTQPLAIDNFVGIDTELWLTSQQAREIAKSIHNTDELHVLVSAGFTSEQATTLLFSAKEALFKAICPFIGEYFGFDAAQLEACYMFECNTMITGRSGWLQLQLTANWVATRAPQQKYRCWFNCRQFDVLTLVCSNAVDTQWLDIISEDYRYSDSRFYNHPPLAG